ncbi:MAG: hypothetical protein R3296_00525 [Oleiphilaceae bacterium]|nr:hypothetical protein [Oleiphilaceae bacterium]
MPRSRLQQSLACHGNPSGASEPVVLLVPGSTLTPEANFQWNYIPALLDLGRTVCTVELPEKAMGDIQVAAEHLVFAIRDLSARSGQPIQIVGYSQGGMVPRWALRFWPSTRAQVSDLISLAGSHKGTVTAIPSCLDRCAPAFWQQRQDSAFMAALNRDGQETWPEVHYTSAYTRYDEVVFPNFAAEVANSRLAGGDNVANIELQSVCPLNSAEHLAIGTYDPVGWALAKDALMNEGPADPSRVSLETCLQLTMPGVDQSTFLQDFTETVAFIGETSGNAEQVDEEPPLACYATENGC